MVDKISGAGGQCTPPGTGPAEAAGRVKAADRVQPAEAESKPHHSADRADSVELSAEARALAGGEAQGVSYTRDGSLSPERVRSVVERLEAGYYDSEGMRHTIASRILDDLNGG
jgi:hypothetical protein